MAKRRTNRNLNGPLAWLPDSLQAVSAVKLSGGVVGRLAIVAVVALVVVLGVFAAGAHWDVEPWLVVTTFVTVLVLSLSTCIGMLWYAHGNPQTALMEGAEVLVHQRMQLATKSGALPDDQLEITIDDTMPVRVSSPDAAMLPDVAESQRQLTDGRQDG